jgi:hypothetical protein
MNIVVVIDLPCLRDGECPNPEKTSRNSFSCCDCGEYCESSSHEVYYSSRKNFMKS